jgi:ketosteroid isomerase-like protein
MVSPGQAERFVDGFARGWSAPHPHAWDDLFDPDAVVEQPLLATGPGLLPAEFARLFRFLPDLTGRVVRWGLAADAVLIELTCTGTVAGRPISFTVVDRCILGDDGRCTRRTTYMDPMPLAFVVAARPASWWRWWSSGVGPWLGRRRILPRPVDDSVPAARADDGP